MSWLVSCLEIVKVFSNSPTDKRKELPFLVAPSLFLKVERG